MEAIQGQVVSEESNFVTRAFFTLIDEVGLSLDNVNISSGGAFLLFQALMKLLADYGIARVNHLNTKLRYKMSKSLTKASGVFLSNLLQVNLQTRLM